MLLLPQRVAEIECGVGEPRVERQGAAERRFRIGKAREHRERVAEIAPRDRIAVVRADRLLQQIGGSRVLTGAVDEQAEVMERVGVRGLAREDRAIAGLRFGVTAGLVQLHRFLQYVSHRSARVGSGIAVK